MRIRTFSLALAFVPMVLYGQSSGRSQAQAQASATANARVSLEPPREFSAEGRAKLEAMYKEAREKDLPPEPVARRVAEGRAKGATEAQILVSAEKVKGNLEATHSAMVRAGRKPTPSETETGAAAIEQGVTEAQLEAMAKKTPSDRSLTVAFDVLSELTAKGMPVGNALTQVQAKLDARAPDSAIQSLTGSVTGRIGIGRGRGGH
jgi:hypothetical protein